MNRLLQKNVKMVLRRRPELQPLFDKLLSMGGEYVVLAFNERDYVNILHRGFLQDGKYPIMKLGTPCHCHSNSAALWDINRNFLRIVTGYALSKDQLWRQHSWCVNILETMGNGHARIVETTVKRILYFGYMLTETESEEFFAQNCL